MWLDINDFWKKKFDKCVPFKFFPLWARRKFCRCQSDRKRETLFTNILFDQNYLNKFRFKINRAHSPLCRHCHTEDETPLHILECKICDLNIKTKKSIIRNILKYKYKIEIFLGKYFDRCTKLEINSEK